MNDNPSSMEARIDRLHQPGLIDMHFDMLMDLYEKRHRAGVLESDYLSDFQAGGIGVVGAAIYIEDKYLPEMALRVALDQISCLYAEVDRQDPLWQLAAGLCKRIEVNIETTKRPKLHLFSCISCLSWSICSKNSRLQS